MTTAQGKGWTTIIKSSNQVSRTTPLKRVSVPKNFDVAPESRIGRGKKWSAPGGAVRVKSFEFDRCDPDTGENPRLDTFENDLDDCGSIVLDTLFWIKNKTEWIRVWSRCGRSLRSLRQAAELSSSRTMGTPTSPEHGLKHLA